MLPVSTGHNLSTTDTTRATDSKTCIHGKMIKQPSMWQNYVLTKLPPPLHQLQGDIFGLINPPSDSSDILLLLWTHLALKYHSLLPKIWPSQNY